MEKYYRCSSVRERVELLLDLFELGYDIVDGGGMDLISRSDFDKYPIIGVDGYVVELYPDGHNIESYVTKEELLQPYE